jgi:translation initiation factor 2 gamma subunit (eIF-2gamma)
LLTVDGDILAGPVGGNLQFGRLANRDDIKIRPGTRVR